MGTSPGLRAPWLEWAVELWLLALLFLAPLPAGSVALWAESGLFLGSLVLLGLWGARELVRGEIRIVRHWIWLPLGLFLGYVALQLAPLPADFLTRMPKAGESYAHILSDGVTTHALSLAPYETSRGLCRLLSLAIFFWVTVHVVRTHAQVRRLTWTLALVGSTQVALSLLRFLPEADAWFGLPPDGLKLQGSYVSRNHFAGLLEMIIPVVLGLVIAMRTSEHRTRPSQLTLPWREHVRRLFSGRYWGQTALLLTAATAMSVGVLFSLSRSGIGCLAVALTGLTIALALTRGQQKLALAPLAVVVLTCGYFVYSGKVVQKQFSNRFTHLDVTALLDSSPDNEKQSVVEGDQLDEVMNLDVLTRMELSLSAVATARAFPWFGVGFGAYPQTFWRFQSLRFGDLMGNYAHNDWLQFLAETGVVGGCLLLAMLAAFLWRCYRVLRNRRSKSIRWGALGCLFGVGAILLHSLTDFNLSKIPANGVVFAVICALAVVWCHIPARTRGSKAKWRHWVVPIRAPALRVIAGLIALAAIIAMAGQPWKRLRGHLAFGSFVANAYEGDPLDYYYFLPHGRPAPKAKLDAKSADLARTALDRCVSIDPDNPYYWRYLARRQVREAGKLLHAEAEKAAKSILQATTRGAEVRSDALAQLTQSFMVQLSNNHRGAPQPHLEEAVKSLKRYITLNPCNYAAQLDLVDILLQLNPKDKEISLCLKRAPWLAPYIPRCRFRTANAWLRFTEISSANGVAKDLDKQIISGYRIAIFADSRYAFPAFTAVDAHSERNVTPLAITPPTSQAASLLYNYQVSQNRPAEMSAALDLMDQARKERRQRVRQNWRTTWRQYWTLQNQGADELLTEKSGLARPDPRDATTLNFIAQRGRVRLALSDGDWAQLQKCLPDFRTSQQRLIEKSRPGVHGLVLTQQYADAMKKYRQFLQQDWDNVRVLLDFSELLQQPNLLTPSDPWLSSLDPLAEIVYQQAPISPFDYDRFVKLVKASREKGPIWFVDFLLGAGAILAGKEDQGLGRLAVLSKTDPPTIDSSGGAREIRQWHMIDYYLGLGYEQKQKLMDAQAAYRRVLARVPTHWPAFQRLAQLSKTHSTVAGKLPVIDEPSTVCNIGFGGRIKLLGYTLEPEAAETNTEIWKLTLYWEIQQPTIEPYAVRIVIQDPKTGKALFTKSLPLSNFPGNLPPEGKKVIYESQAGRSGEMITQQFKLGKIPQKQVRVHILLAGEHIKLMTRLGATGIQFALPMQTEDQKPEN